MKKIQVFYWVKEIRRGRKDLDDEQRLDRPLEIALDMIVAYGLEMDPYTTPKNWLIPWAFPQKR
jgi:hypothetical protein